MIVSTEPVTLTFSGYDPDAFFDTGEGLWIHNSFREHVLGKAKSLRRGMKCAIFISEVRVETLSTPEEVCHAASGKPYFDESGLCAILAEMTQGDVLLDKKKSYTLCTKSCTVRLLYFRGIPAQLGQWGIGTWPSRDIKDFKIKGDFMVIYPAS